MNRRENLKLLTASIALGLGLTGGALAQSKDTIKVGILHRLSGTMAISETVLKDTVGAGRRLCGDAARRNHCARRWQ